jgi:glutamate formiminotransferase/formiminotetrahydrofolate cyclodeaminase
LAARAAVLGAWLNVRINAASIKDRNRVEDLLKEAAGMAELARQKEDAILEIVNAKI